MRDSGQAANRSWWRTPLLHRVAKLQEREDQVFLVLALVIGALTGLAVVAFILLTERMGMRLYPVGGAPWRRLLFPVVGSLGIGYLLYRYFPNARGSGVPSKPTRSTSTPCVDSACAWYRMRALRPRSISATTTALIGEGWLGGAPIIDQ